MLILGYTKIYLLELIRNKSAAFFTIFFPTLLLLLFGRNGDSSSIGQWHMFIAMSNYAVQSSLFLSLGLSVSYNRESQWTLLLRTLPVSPLYRVLGQVFSMCVIGFLSLVLLIVVGIFWFPHIINLSKMGAMFLFALLGGIPMGLLAVLIAYLVRPITARSVFVIVNLLLFFASFSIPEQGALSFIRFFIPSCQWFSLSSSVILGQAIDHTALYCLVAYTLIFGYILARVKR
jgi:ABC-2 type transport system permease protein